MTSETPRTIPTDPDTGELAGAIGQRGYRWMAPSTDSPPATPFADYANEHTYAGEPTGETADGADLGIGGIGFGIGRCECPGHRQLHDGVREANRRSWGEGT
ncbi:MULTISPECIES: hypothetical protein [Streptomyces]|uniref:hypothetical protein n=1 Tax=Streptomyces TaxID=1883 RepID=UPI00131AC3F2|nr:hypothetical protein [Streptomyces sp. CB02120-2]